MPLDLGRSVTVHSARCLVLFLLLTLRVWAVPGDDVRVEPRSSAGSITLVADGRAAPLYVASADHPGVRRATRSLQEDFQRVSGVRPALHEAEAVASAPRDRESPESASSAASSVIIVGTIGRSPLIDQLVRERKLDVQAIAGRWEAFLHEVVANPYPGVQHALVIAGSDPRGTIYGLYTLSEQIGVSPWYWWADVPVRPSSALHHRAGRWVDEGPVVKYRGIFLNDEAPALTGWVQEKFGGFNHRFYERLFEVMLRLRANYLWPAMWLPRAFNDDDPQNPVLANDYGIVMGTSHHEPMMRAHDEWNRSGRGPWNYATNAETLRDFWRGGLARVKDFEKIVTIGMRGDGDEAMSEETNVALLERIVSDQRQIIRDVMGRDPAQVPQLWALYKEVQGYYERGMRVPDDVILLWCDDNWGNIRRLPTPEERKRPGGAGVYYHFDYVGGPRNYKWINVTPITKVWEQMHLAWQYGADRIWIVNVGDFKPMEFPTEFFLAYAWNPARWPYERLTAYSEAWAARDFGPAHATEIAALVNGYSKLNRRRTPEMLEPTTLSLAHDREAERVLGEWRELVERAERVRANLPAEFQDAYFQLVLYPVRASANIWELYVAAGLNRWYALQGRAAANTQAERVRTLFEKDAALRDAYHALGGGRWNHQMAQIKMGYTYWQTPNIEAAPAVQQVRPLAGAEMAIAIEGSERSWPSYNAGRAQLPPLDPYRRGTRWIEVFNRGAEPFGFRASADQPWVRLEPSDGRVEEQTRIEVSVDWAAVPPGAAGATISLTGHQGARHQVHLPIQQPPAPPKDGFVEVDRHVAIEAPHFTRAIGRGEIEWRVLPDFGRTVGGVTTFPVTAPAQEPGDGGPRLEYDVHLVSTGELTLELHCAPSLDFQPGEGLRFAVSLGDGPPQVVRLNTWETLQTWEKAVGESIRRVKTTLNVERPGVHTLKVWMVTPGVVFERLIIDAGGVRPSYFGPPESPRG